MHRRRLFTVAAIGAATLVAVSLSTSCSRKPAQVAPNSPEVSVTTVQPRDVPRVLERVATRSSTRGTSRGCTVVTETSGEFGATCAGLREQLVLNDTATNVAAPIAATVNKRRRCMESLVGVSLREN